MEIPTRFNVIFPIGRQSERIFNFKPLLSRDYADGIKIKWERCRQSTRKRHPSPLVCTPLAVCCRRATKCRAKFKDHVNWAVEVVHMGIRVTCGSKRVFNGISITDKLQAFKPLKNIKNCIPETQSHFVIKTQLSIGKRIYKIGQ